MAKHMLIQMFFELAYNIRVEKSFLQNEGEYRDGCSSKKERTRSGYSAEPHGTT